MSEIQAFLEKKTSFSRNTFFFIYWHLPNVILINKRVIFGKTDQSDIGMDNNPLFNYLNFPFLIILICHAVHA